VPTHNEQDYLKAICKIELTGGRASTTQLARELGVAPASVTTMSKRLERRGLVERTPYRGFELTPAGRRDALEMVRHHRLIETFLVQTLGYSADRVHDDAERLEHALSEELEERIDAQLGRPTHDPHGDPIPNRNLELPDA
jgi:DtxR family Mn-dependent transcriptional regulator